MNKYFIVVLLLIISNCTVPKTEKILPFLGNAIMEEEDTIYHTIQDFRLINQDSIYISNNTFNDKIYVADFFFISCPTICPIMKTQMLRVYERYKDKEDFAILSHTIDPKHDTVSLLKGYAESLGVESSKWHFLTGVEQDYMYDLAEKSYMVMVKADSMAEGGYIHSGAFLLVDKERRIRGAYDGTVSEQVDALINDIDLLLNEK